MSSQFDEDLTMLEGWTIQKTREFKELFIWPPTISLIKNLWHWKAWQFRIHGTLKCYVYGLPWIILAWYKNLWPWKARQFRIYGNLKCYTWSSINNFIVIKIHGVRMLGNYHHRRVRVGCKNFTKSAHPASKHHPSKIIRHRYLWRSYNHHPTSSTDKARRSFGK
jgi:hypothetical protein